MKISNGIDVNPEWVDSIAVSRGGNLWSNLNSENLSVRPQSTSTRDGSQKFKITILDGKEEIEFFFLDEVENQPTWTNDLAGLLKASDDIATWINKYSFDFTGIITGLATENTLELVRLLLVSLEAKDFSTETTLALAKTVLDNIKLDTTSLDVALSTRATEATLELTRLLLVSLDGKDYSTETTLALIKPVLDAIKLDTAKLDVDLSTRASETTLALLKIATDAIKLSTDNLDVALSTVSTEATLALAKTVLDNIKLDTAKLDVNLSTVGDSFKNSLLQVDTVGNTHYLGYANAGSATSGTVWAIKKVVEVGNDVTITWADGTKDFDNIWDDRLTLTYS